MREIPLVEVLAMRLANNTTEHHRFYTVDVLRQQIATEMSGAIQARWNAALDAAVNSSEEPLPDWIKTASPSPINSDEENST